MNRQNLTQVAFALALAVGVTAQRAGAAPQDLEGNTSHGLAGSAYVNALGPLQFGLTPSLELGTSNFAGLLRFRWLNSGFLANETLPTKGGSESLAFSYGLGAGVRYFTAADAPLTGFNLGVVLEFLRVRNEDTTIDREAYLTSLLVPQLEGGYRWAFGHFLLGAGAGVGYAIVVSAKTEDSSGGADNVLLANNAENKPYGSVAVDVGFLF